MCDIFSGPTSILFTARGQADYIELGTPPLNMIIYPFYIINLMFLQSYLCLDTYTAMASNTHQPPGVMGNGKWIIQSLQVPPGYFVLISVSVERNTTISSLDMVESVNLISSHLKKCT